jgi:hypothetical protein
MVILSCYSTDNSDNMHLIPLFSIYFLTSSLFAQANVQHYLPASYASDFIDVYVAVNDQGFAVGTCGTLIKTTDGGQNWVTINSPTEEELLLITCRPGTGSNQVFATTRTTLFRSLNGGDS